MLLTYDTFCLDQLKVNIRTHTSFEEGNYFGSEFVEDLSSGREGSIKEADTELATERVAPEHKVQVDRI